MKKTAQISAMLLSIFTFANVSMANAKSGDVIRCNSKCWQDMGDLSDIGQKCFMFYITQETNSNFSARMDGGYDDDGNQNSYQLGPVTKSYGVNGSVIWTLQQDRSVKAIEFSQENWTQNGTCEIKTKTITFQGTTNYF